MARPQQENEGEIAALDVEALRAKSPPPMTRAEQRARAAESGIVEGPVHSVTEPPPPSAAPSSSASTSSPNDVESVARIVVDRLGEAFLDLSRRLERLEGRTQDHLDVDTQDHATFGQRIAGLEAKVENMLERLAMLETPIVGDEDAKPTTTKKK